jgi:hypothetical protein
MAPALDAYLILRVIFWAMMFLAAVYILYAASGYLTGEPPTSVRRAALVVLVVAATVYLTYDLTGYLFFLAIQDPDLGIHLPPGFTYWDWFEAPLAVKWHVLGFVPIIRFLPVVFALCAGGTLFLLIWAIEWREAAVLFAAQLVLNAVALVVLSYVFTTWAEWVGVEVRPPAGVVPEEPADPRAPPPDLDRLDQRVCNLPAERGTVWRRLGDRWDGVNGHLAPLYALLAPVTRHLPPPAQDFLDSGGWLLVFAGLAALCVVWPRFHRSPTRKRRRRPTPPSPSPRIDLSLVGGGVTARGPRQATVGGVPARLRLVVLVPADPAAGRLTADAAPGLLEAVRPGLAEVLGYDFPRVEVWPDIRPHETFRRAFEADVGVPDPSGRPSRWVVLLGTATAGGGPAHVGLALYTDRPTADRVVELPAGGWAGVVGLRDVPAEDRDD